MPAPVAAKSMDSIRNSSWAAEASAGSKSGEVGS